MHANYRLPTLPLRSRDGTVCPLPVRDRAARVCVFLPGLPPAARSWLRALAPLRAEFAAWDGQLIVVLADAADAHAPELPEYALVRIDDGARVRLGAAAGA